MKRRDVCSTTNKQIQDLLPSVLGNIRALQKDRPDLILATWPEIIGDKLAPMTEAVHFQNGILLVKVRNSTLYSVLAQHEKARLLKKLRAKFPSVEIKTIQFRVG